jgi:hypothetical protein
MRCTWSFAWMLFSITLVACTERNDNVAREALQQSQNDGGLMSNDAATGDDDAGTPCDWNGLFQDLEVHDLGLIASTCSVLLGQVRSDSFYSDEGRAVAKAIRDTAPIDASTPEEARAQCDQGVGIWYLGPTPDIALLCPEFCDKIRDLARQGLRRHGCEQAPQNGNGGPGGFDATPPPGNGSPVPGGA